MLHSYLCYTWEPGGPGSPWSAYPISTALCDCPRSSQVRLVAFCLLSENQRGEAKESEKWTPRYGRGGKHDRPVEKFFFLPFPRLHVALSGRSFQRDSDAFHPAAKTLLQRTTWRTNSPGRNPDESSAAGARKARWDPCHYLMHCGLEVDTRGYRGSVDPAQEKRPGTPGLPPGKHARKRPDRALRVQETLQFPIPNALDPERGGEGEGEGETPFITSGAV